MARVYVETTIPSFYYEVRTRPEHVARRQWTRQWWEKTKHELVTSSAVLDELEDGRYPSKEAALGLIARLPLLIVGSEIIPIVEEYIRRKLMPNDPTGDALHLALASHYACDFLVTWNCRHLANANKFGHIRRINEELGLHVPTLTTPMEMLGEEGS